MSSFGFSSFDKVKFQIALTVMACSAITPLSTSNLQPSSSLAFFKKQGSPMHDEHPKRAYQGLNSTMSSAAKTSPTQSTTYKTTIQSPGLNSLWNESGLLEQYYFDDKNAHSCFEDLATIQSVTGGYAHSCFEDLAAAHSISDENAMIDDSLDIPLSGLQLDISLAKYVSYE